MPTYEYKCYTCNGVFDAMQSMSAEPLGKCRLCASSQIKKLISAPSLNTIKSTSPTGASYEKLTTREVFNRDGPRLAEMEKQEGIKEKLQLMYSGKLD